MRKDTGAMEHEYEVFDRDSGNAVAFFPSEQATRDAVRIAVQEDSADSIASWLVGRVDHEGPVLEGPALIAWALGTQKATEAGVASEPKAASGAELVAVARLWLTTRGSATQQRELTPLLDTFEALNKEANVLLARGAPGGPIQSAQDVQQLREHGAALERMLSDLTRMRLMIRDWFAHQWAAPQTEEAAAIDEAWRIILASQLRNVA